jgi:undecaprenyl-diphosphatase
VKSSALARLRAVLEVDRADARLLLSLLGVALSVWAFVLVAGLMTRGRVQAFDEQLMLGLRVDGNPSQPLGPAWLPGAVRDVTALGSAPVLLIFVLAVAGALAARRQYHALVLLVAASAGGILLNELLKGLFARPRPDLALRLTDVRSLSFPSGHAMQSAIIYLTLATFLARAVQARALKAYFVAFAFLLSFLVGFSRVYLGVHYPSDVLAGWCAGLAWALVCWTLERHLQHRGKVEPPA